VCTVLPASIDTPLFQHAANFSGRAIKPLRPVYRPEKVAAALLRALRHPRREIVVGGAARLAILTHAIAPAAVERMAAQRVDHDHFQNHPAAASEGNLLRPIEGYATASGGWKEPATGEGEPVGIGILPGFAH
jgi:hypothetical protein